MSDLPVLVATGVQTLDGGLRDYLDHVGLPSDVLALIDDRRKVINNLPDAIDRLSPEQKKDSYYISKMAAACAAGLFDAGLAYLWDAVVANLRERVERFDLEYFFDNTVPPNTREKYKTAEDLTNLDDAKLISGCLTCGILSDVGYKLLDHIRDMRNWASAAHPNNAQVGGLQLIGWLETCVKEVFSIEFTGPAFIARQLLRNLKEQTLTQADVTPVAAKIATLPVDTAAALLRAAIGLYSDLKLDRRVVDNVRLVAQPMWKAAPDEARHDVGMKYAALSVNAEIDRKARVREFLELVDGLTYLPSDHRGLEMQDKLSQLESAHFAMNNFYNEPPLAQELRKFVPATGEIPPAVSEAYVRTITLCFMGRPSGVARNAAPIYEQMLHLFGDTQLRVFVALPHDPRVRSKLESEAPARRFIHAASQLATRTTNRTLAAALSYIASRTHPQAYNLANDGQYKKLLSNLI